MLVSFFDVKGIRLGELRDYTNAPAKCWVRDITITTGQNCERGVRVITLYGAQESDLLTQAELDERVAMVERAAHDDKAEVLAEALRHDNVSEAPAFVKQL